MDPQTCPNCAEAHFTFFLFADAIRCPSCLPPAGTIVIDCSMDVEEAA